MTDQTTESDLAHEISDLVFDHCCKRPQRFDKAYNRLWRKYHDYGGIDLRKRAEHQDCEPIEAAAELGVLDEVLEVAEHLYA